jgi:aryl-alcohol dehydrogenase-like predicted oxidoreductase
MTAETYGDGLSEKLTGKFKKMASENTDESVPITTKFQPGKWKGENSVGKAMLRAAKESCARLGLSQVCFCICSAPANQEIILVRVMLF